MSAKYLRFFAFILFLSFQPSVAKAQDHSSTSAKQAIVIDYDTGMVLLEKKADEHMPTSSMSKVMTMYVVFEAIKNGQLTLDSKLPVSEKAWRKGGSKMFVEVGKQVKVEDLIQGVVVQSGNDATIVLAEGISGTEASFANVLNAKAKMLGLENSHFMNASGWPDPDHYSTARDLAMLATALIRDFPDYYHYFGEREFTYNNIKQPNRNPLLYRNIGADGVKTGHTDDGGYGLMGSGTRNGRRVVMVVNGLKSDKERAQEGTRLLDWALRSFENRTLFKAKENVEFANVVMGKETKVPMMIEKELIVTIPSTLRNDLKVETIYEGPVMAPVKKGDKIGTLKVQVPRLESIEVPLLAGEDVAKLGFFGSALAKLKLMITGGAG